MYQHMSDAIKVNMLELARGNMQIAFRTHDVAATAGMRALCFVEMRKRAVNAEAGLVKVTILDDVSRTETFQGKWCLCARNATISLASYGGSRRSFDGRPTDRCVRHQPDRDGARRACACRA